MSGCSLGSRRGPGASPSVSKHLCQALPGLALPGELRGGARLFLLPLRWRVRRGVRRGVFARGTPRLSREVTGSLSPARGAGDGARGGFSEGASEPVSGCAQTHRAAHTRAAEVHTGRGDRCPVPKTPASRESRVLGRLHTRGFQDFHSQGARLRPSEPRAVPPGPRGHGCRGPRCLVRPWRSASVRLPEERSRTVSPVGLQAEEGRALFICAHIPILLSFFYSHLFFIF